MNEKFRVDVHVEPCPYDPEEYVSIRISGLSPDLGPNVRSFGVRFRMKWSRRGDALGVALLMKPIEKALKLYDLNLSHVAGIIFG
tara:strand:- start:347 stop:601 length:255 start_codon:yes stop_codon:yes gene_type:complete